MLIDTLVAGTPVALTVHWPVKISGIFKVVSWQEQGATGTCTMLVSCLSSRTLSVHSAICTSYEMHEIFKNR